MTKIFIDRAVSGGRVSSLKVSPSMAAWPRMRGATSALRLAVIALAIVLIAGAAWWFMGRPGAPTALQAPAAAPVAPGAQDTLPAVTAAEDLSVDDLYKQARSAMKENRMVTPEGNNALEYYLRILSLQPDDTNAKDALRELFPFATGSAEDQINQGHFDDATRIIALLTTADPSNYTLTILRSKLDARKRQSERELALQAQKEAAALAASSRPQGAAPATPATAAAADAITSAESEPTAVASATPSPAPVAVATPKATPTPAPVAVAPTAPVGETRDVRVVVAPNPAYPAAAVRNRQDGWVEVQFTVDADGSVKNTKVLAGDPRGVFDREALAAVQKAKFEARLENGVPVSSTLRRRIEFKLN